MSITSIYFKFLMCYINFDHATESVIPLSGDEKVITETIRDSYETTIKKFPLSDETVSSFLDLIAQYGIEEWAGKTPYLPEVICDDNCHELCYLTLFYDDGRTVDITFREVPSEVGKEAATAFRKLVFDCEKDKLKISEERVYPTLKESREIIEKHGPVAAVETSSFTSGMMYNSNVWYTQTVEKIDGKDGVVLVTIKRKRGNGPEVAASREIESDILAKAKEISDKENIPGWHYACIDPSIPVDRSMMPTDFSASGSLNVYYDDSLITGCPRSKRTISESACKMGGAEVDRLLTSMVNECVKASGVKDDLPDSEPLFVPGTVAVNNGFPMGMGVALTQAPAGSSGEQANSFNDDGTWNCTCGAKNLTGKFCPECGSARGN